MKRTLTLTLVLLLVVTLFAGCSSSSAEYPTKDIQFYISGDAGGGADSICRKITQIIEDNNENISFYMVNKAGVADSVASSLTMDADPDGYTICGIPYGAVISAVYQEVVENFSMDRLTPIAFVTEEANAFVVSKDAPYATWDEMIAYAKDHPGEIKLGDIGVGTHVYIIVTKIEQEFGISFNKISYSSSAPQREALLSGEVDIIVSSLGDFAPVLDSGDGIGICEFSTARNAAYPDVPTCLELGMSEDFLSGSFMYVAAPAGTPEDVIDTLEAAFEEAVLSDEFSEWTTSIGVTPVFKTSEEIVDYVADLQEREFAALDALAAEGLI